MGRASYLLLLLVAACGQSASGPADAAAQARPARTEVALFAGGCFWSAESDIEHIPGVVTAVSGYAGGSVANPTYAQVLTGRTGHVEAVRVTYDPARIGYAQLVRRFLRTIDPTDGGGQFCDRGPTYRTTIFALNPGQRRHALAALAEANRILGGRVVTPVVNASGFYPAESYHQDYAARNPGPYQRYRRGCGKDARIRQVWGAAAG